MRVGIDGRTLTGRFTGDRTYWRNLLQVLPTLDRTDQYVVYTRIPVPSGELPPAPNLTFRVLPAANDRLWSLATLPRAVREDRIDLLHVQYTVPRFCKCPVITTVQDISFRLYPEWFPFIDRTLLNATIPGSMRAAARVITASESSRRDILRLYNLPPEKVVAALLGLPEGFGLGEPGPGGGLTQETARRFANMRLGVDKPFVLAVGVLQPRKNLRLLAEAFGMARKEYRLPHSLVLAGKAGWGTEQEALRMAAERGGGPQAAEALVFPGYIEDEDLPALYRAASVFAYPSLYEGFGLPPLEAMASGTPVLVSDRPAMPEVVGDAAEIVPATDAAAWSKALGELLTDEAKRCRLAARGPAHAARFSWTETARRTRAVYQEVRG